MTIHSFTEARTHTHASHTDAHLPINTASTTASSDKERLEDGLHILARLGLGHLTDARHQGGPGGRAAQGGGGIAGVDLSQECALQIVEAAIGKHGRVCERLRA
jgi:hypothetical protein